MNGKIITEVIEGLDRKIAGLQRMQLKSEKRGGGKSVTYQFKHDILDLPMNPETNAAQAETVRQYLTSTVQHFWFAGPHHGLSQEQWKNEIRSAMPPDKCYTDASIAQALRDWGNGL